MTQDYKRQLFRFVLLLTKTSVKCYYYLSECNWFSLFEILYTGPDCPNLGSYSIYFSQLFEEGQYKFLVLRQTVNLAYLYRDLQPVGCILVD